MSRTLLISGFVILGGVFIVGCQPKDSGGIDKPLMTNAPPPPPRPNKPEVSPSAGGGGGGAAKGGAPATGGAGKA